MNDVRISIMLCHSPSIPWPPSFPHIYRLAKPNRSPFYWFSLDILALLAWQHRTIVGCVDAKLWRVMERRLSWWYHITINWCLTWRLYANILMDSTICIYGEARKRPQMLPCLPSLVNVHWMSDLYLSCHFPSSFTSMNWALPPSLL